MIEAKIICDSINPAQNRLTTFVITYPRFILAEFNTHRMLSRNSASSRAIPISKMIKMVLENPAEPVSWGQNGKGMQAKSELIPSKQFVARQIWLKTRYLACGAAWLLSKVGAHKQLANRLLEPWAHVTTIVSGTEWGNFFNLRTHPDAQPEFQILAKLMLNEYKNHIPKEMNWGEWHLPFGDRYLKEGLTSRELKKISVARCARVSYLTFDGEIDHEKDYKLCDQLIESGHMSPTEHAARALSGWSGNFNGWRQYRKTLPNENRDIIP